MRRKRRGEVAGENGKGRVGSRWEIKSQNKGEDHAGIMGQKIKGNE